MAQWGFVFDQRKCIGCNACQMACKDAHNLEAGVFYRRVDTLEYEEDGQTVFVHFSGSCNHCAEAACVKHCLTGAMHHAEDGTVHVDQGLCIGCGTCAWACPYGAVGLSHRSGTVVKCDSCMELRQKGQNPVCVDACLTHCLEFRDLDLMSEEERAHCVADMTFLPDASETRPSLRIRRKKCGGSSRGAGERSDRCQSDL